MNLEALESWFDSRIGLNFHKGQERLLEALELLDHPERQFASIQIAGTNGKGSTQAILGQLLLDQGYKVGAFTSPHLEDMRERVRLNGHVLPLERLSQLALRLQEVEAQMQLGPLSYFELWTCVAFLYFAEEAVDVALLEVGIGGRHDATNVVESELALITSIGLDHQELLGSSLTAIACEKAGIVNAEQELLLGPLSADLLPVFEEEVARFGNPIFRFGQEFVWQDQTFWTNGLTLEELKLSLPGAYQRENAALALMAALRWARIRGQDLDLAQMRRSLERVQWPGRLELLAPGVYLDGAHNVPALERLVEFIKAQAWDTPIFLLGFLPRKNYQEMVAYLRQHLPHASYYLVPFDGGLEDGSFLGLDRLEKGIATFIREEERRPIFITGSLHFVGQVRKGWISE
ncbi:Mur ligase family protein [Streptococcus sp. NLN64]|uniref:bifunctional folylpolyglutamate synthase/dihydrofolate synthase n=1 Tax=Streptococcus sp. NLN64 TaxID=2822799 RepID=UPI0018CB78ED|nr:Mur ligase family protein [Streptococcus sp. NLN64]MBG9366945.1 bifunctional folylpolyglutamate synthase/dihydrofolate synthase [Streptococcus sp. NLN64]